MQIFSRISKCAKYFERIVIRCVPLVSKQRPRGSVISISFENDPSCSKLKKKAFGRILFPCICRIVSVIKQRFEFLNKRTTFIIDDD